MHKVCNELFTFSQRLQWYLLNVSRQRERRKFFFLCLDGKHSTNTEKRTKLMYFLSAVQVLSSSKRQGAYDPVRSLWCPAKCFVTSCPHSTVIRFRTANYSFMALHSAIIGRDILLRTIFEKFEFSNYTRNKTLLT